jgi:DMSO reductase anchor subunit
MLKEWPLVAFTILGQTAVGLFWLFHLPFLVTGRVPAYGWRMTWLAVLGAVALLMLLAAGVSFFHLRHPLRARRALSNLRTSWLSREILFELVFIFLVVSAAGLEGLDDPEHGLQWVLLTAAVAAGGLFLASMAKLYMLPALPVWRRSYTPLTFLATTLAAGAVATELVVRVAAGPGAFPVDLLTIALAVIAGEIILAAVAAPRMGWRGFQPAPSLRPGGASAPFLHAARLAFLLAGMALITIDKLSASGDIMAERGAPPILCLALVFVLAGEAAGRFHYYGLVPRPGD